MFLELLLCLITTIFLYFWYKQKRVQSFLNASGVRFVPGWPVFGNTFDTTFQRGHMFHDIDEVYKAFPDEKYVGFIENSKLVIIIRDPELIRLITVKDFDHFTDHKELVSEHIEPFFGTSLLLMKGGKWHNMRTTLSPAFTGSKMKMMMHLMIAISQNIVEYLKEHCGEDLDVDDLMRRYTNDVIASTSFGLEVNSLKDRDNEFFLMGQKLLTFNFRQLLLSFMDKHFPSLVKKSGLKVYPEKTYSLFRSMIVKNLEYRKQNNVRRPDMLQLMLETPRDWTLDELCAQAFLFFGAGFETSASALALTVHELAVNPDVQERLYQEIRTLKDQIGDTDITGDNIASLNYLDGVLSETLRKWSPAIVVDRTCVKTYTLPPPHEGGKPYTLKPGDLVYNSCNSLHLDPKYWPEPLKYDPDRWSEQNKHNIKPFTYQPFGLGPRICIASRFAIQEVKVLLYYLVLNFKMLKCKKTTDPIELIRSGYNILAEGGTWAQFEKRT